MLFEGEELLSGVYYFPVLDGEPTRLIPGFGNAGGGGGGRLGGKKAISYRLQQASVSSHVPRQHKGGLSNLCPRETWIAAKNFVCIVKRLNCF